MKSRNGRKCLSLYFSRSLTYPYARSSGETEKSLGHAPVILIKSQRIIQESYYRCFINITVVTSSVEHSKTETDSELKDIKSTLYSTYIYCNKFSSNIPPTCTSECEH